MEANVGDLLRQGIAAAKAGQRERARDLLMEVVERDEENIQAWLWLSGVVDSLEDREVCLENVLSLDPDNDAARRGLVLLQKQREAQEPQPAPIPEPPAVARTRTAATPAAAMLREAYASYLSPPEPELQGSPPSAPDEFDDEYLCPYCAVPTDPDDRRCRTCGNDLWVKFRRQEKRSTLLWILITFQLSSTLQLAVAPLLLLAYVLIRAAMAAPGQIDYPDPLPLLNAYLGLPTALPPGIVSFAFAMVPRPLFFLSWLPCLFSGAVLAGLYARWKPVYYLLLADALIVLIAAFLGMIVARNIGFGALGLGLALLRVLLVFQLEDDFQWDKRRLVLRVDRDVSGGTDFMIRGDFYAKRKMWAMAAIHLRRAVGSMPHDPDSHVALAVAYLRLKRYDLAARTLEQARRIVPGDPKVDKLQALLDDIRAPGLTGGSM